MIMGGALFKESRRVSSFLFRMYSSQIGFFLENKIGLENCPVKFFRDKKDHGDIDILVFISSLTDIRPIILELKEIPGLTQVSKNGNVLSLLYNNVQIDLILINEIFKETSKLFFFYNDFGLLLGKLFYYHRLKFSPEGVKYKVKHLQYGKEINVFNDVEQIFNFLGLDKNRYDEGFDSLEDMFEYFISSKLFCIEAFDSSLWKSDQRNRDFKRKNLLYFYEWIKDKELSSIERPTKEEIFKMVNEITNGEAQLELDDLIYHDNLKNQISEKFNGNILMEIFPILGEFPKYLGIFITTFKEKFDDSEHFCEYLEVTDKQEYLNDLEEHLHQLGF